MNKLLCIDGNSILNRAFYGIKLLSTKDGAYTNGIYGFINILLKLQDDLAPDAIACAFDVKAPTFRHKQYQGYKAQRKGMPEELAQQLPILKELLSAMGIPIVEAPGYEGDDILGTLAKAARGHKIPCFIATGDRDSLQLVGDGVEVLLTSTRMGATETIHCDEGYVTEKYGLAPHQLIDVKALMGDSSDNIPGVAGIGEKTAVKLIQEYGSLDALYENIDSASLTSSVRQKLVNGREMAYLSRDLGTICCDVPIDANVESYLLYPMDKAAAYRLLARLEMSRIIKKLDLEGSAGAAETAPVDSAASAGTLKISRNPEDTAAARETGSPLCIAGRWAGRTLTAVAAAWDDTLLLLDRETCEDFDRVLGILLEAPASKSFVSSKEFFSYCLPAGLVLKNIWMDAAIAGYLLSPNATDYTPAMLCGQYGVTPHSIEGDLPEGLAALAGEAAALPGLTKALRGLLRENEQEKLFDEIELPLAKVLSSMEVLGFSVDTEGIRAYGEKLDIQIEALQAAIFEEAGEQFNINSPRQLGVILFDKLGLPARKKTKTGYSTSADVLDSLRGKHPIVDHLLEYRKLTKLKSTYVEGLVKAAGPDGRIHSSFNQTETRTGRISSAEPNLQNIPVRTELGSQLRRFFTARAGCVLVDADYSQIELRVLAHIASDENMIEAFRSGEDIHTQTAAQVFDMPPLFVTPQMRSQAKAVNFGIVYGIGAYSLSQDIGVTLSQADKYIKDYLKTYHGVRDYMASTVEKGKEQGYVSTLFGRRRYLPELASTNKTIQAFGRRVAMNTPIQGTAADIIKIAMVRVYNRLEAESMQSRLILQIHDELIVEAPQEETERVRIIVKEEMENAAQLTAPLIVDVGTGFTWYDAKG